MSTNETNELTLPPMQIITQQEHHVQVEDIGVNAIKVLRRLTSAGYEAYLVGGCVRDLLLNKHPKDFDIATDATPEQIKAQFKNCRIIGRRFRLAHVIFGREVIEVATFRGPHIEQTKATDKSKKDGEGQLVRDNVFGSLQQDAARRDFTINAMYYNVNDGSIRDFAGGLDSIKRKTISLIGDPETRYREDPVRMLRAVRFAAKLDMQIDSASEHAIKKFAYLLENIPPARLFEEVLKLFFNGQGLATYHLLLKYGLFDKLFPQTGSLLNTDTRERKFIDKVITNTDNRINTGQRVTPAFLYAAMLWYPIEEQSQKLACETDLSPADAFNMAMTDVLQRQLQRIMIPKRFSVTMREIWAFQHRLGRRHGRRAHQMLAHPRFRAAYDFLLLRGEIEGGQLYELADWWTEFQEANSDQRKTMIDNLLGHPNGKVSRRRKPSKSKRKPNQI
ncbi:polynucleotide adenylyltransferase PcnB [Glaciecola sp.]|nr:polynucleotide adenylyltransferase PcnB [Glaciecola sp.]